MFSTARRWLRRNKTPIAIGVGVVGAGYVVTQYVLNKINDARERMSSERISKENLRRRFEQNQEDCTFTVLALLPTATTNILEAMNTESITLEIQQMKSTKGVRSGESNGPPPSIADTTLTEEEGRSMASFQSDSGVHASQVVATPSTTSAPSISEGAQQQPETATKKKSKRQLWDDLTISAITRSFSLIYTLALLAMFTRVQLNLLGRRSYLSSVVALATSTQQATISLENHDDDNADQAYGNDFDTNRKYLTFSWWLLHRGYADIVARVESAVRTVFGSLSPRDLVSFDRFSELTMQVRKLVEGATPQQRQEADWLKFLLPPRDKEDEVIRESGVLEENPAQQSQGSQASSASLRRLLDETADLIESPAFSHVLTLLLDAGFSSLVDKKLANEAFEFPAPNEGGILVTDNSELKHTQHILLPKILSVLTRQAHVIGNGVPNEYLQDMEKVRDLEAFAAVVYSSNWQNEVREEGLMDSAVYVEKPSETTLDKSTQDDPSVALADSQQSGLECAWERAMDKQA
ncbi:Peroxisomal biogenesis factor-like protein [Emericellopsis cladophorae]|uniref:Peroxisomal biogenesis factor-like protein n=1 Tax=Emericellopsis cladophorae TaxID=2686198 RepID=A0A9Q0BIL5_9HYPO|nr:Peroxisomal biogenesis factor-like protein [Emericellopsis cladophorae]KAI6785764.1 Peroxisomal biogenesis factor-like protein [Emericellopsis cladophorae]